MMKITAVHFVNPLPIGRELDTHKYLVNGSRILGNVLDITKYDGMFMRISITNSRGERYDQFIPWAQVATVLFEEVKSDKSSKKGD